MKYTARVVPIGNDHRYLAREIRLGMAVVFVDRPPGHLRADTVLADNAGGARSGVAHLIAAGHRRIGILTDDLGVYTMAQRFDGYRAALADAAISFDPVLARHDCHDIHDARAATLSLLAATVFVVASAPGALTLLLRRPAAIVSPSP